jgi:transglutaminase/protease-like cytokinesis protein 3
MLVLKQNIIALVFSLLAFCAQAQEGNYETVDLATKTLGALPTKNVAEIATIITQDLNGNKEKARAIFYWIANNIEIDPKALKQNSEKNSLPEQVIQIRKATPQGFAKLFQEMCSQVKIRCLTVNGWVKNNAIEITEKPEEKNYTWNVVQLGQTPEAWHYVNTCRASGYTDAAFKTFTKQFESNYFFTDKDVFDLVHWPDNSAWQLGKSAKSKGDFFERPILGPAAVALGVKKTFPEKGLITPKLDQKISFKINTTNENEIKELVVLIGDKKPRTEKLEFNQIGKQISFNYNVKKEDDAPFTIVADGKVLLHYFLTVK